MNNIKNILKKINLFHLLLAFLIIFPLSQLILGGKEHINEALYNYNEIGSEKATVSSQGGKEFDSPEVNDDRLFLLPKKKSAPIMANAFTVSFGKEEEINRLFVRINSGKVNNFNIYISRNGSWEKVESVYNNDKSFYTGYYTGLKTDKVRITLASPIESNNQLLDVLSYQKTDTNNIFEKGFNLIFKQQRSLLSYFFYSLLFFILIFLTGQVAYRPFGKFFHLEENILFSFAVGFIALGLIGLVLSLLPIRLGTQTLAIIAFMILVVIALRRLDFQKLQDTLLKNKKIFLAVFLFFIFICSWSFVFDQIPNKITSQYDLVYGNNQKYFSEVGYNYASDSIFPYVAFKGIRYGLDNLQGEWSKSTIDVNFMGRPQLASYAAFPFLVAFGDTFFAYQAFIIGSLAFLVLACFYLVKELFNPKTAYLTIGILMLNYYFFYIYQLTAIKLIASFFVFLLFYCLARFKKTGATKYLIIGSVFGAVAFLVHNFTISYAIAGIFFLSPNPLRWLKERRTIILGTGLIFLVFAGWFIVGKFTGGDKLLEQVATGGFTGNKLMNSQNLGSPFVQNLKARYLNIKGLFITNPFPEYWPGRGIYGFYKVTLVGALTVFFGPFIALGMWAFRKRGYMPILVSLLLVPFLISLLSHSFPGLFGIHLYLIPSIPIFIAFGALFLNTYRRIKLPALILVFTEWLYVGFIYYPLELTDKLTHYPAKSVLFLVALLLFPLIYSVVILVKESDKSLLEKF